MGPPAEAERAEALPAPAPTPSPGRARRVAALAVGTLLLVSLVSYTGIGPVLERLAALGWRAPLALLPYLVISVLDTLGWRQTLPGPARVPFTSLYLARIAGEAVNSLTPTAAVGGEPVKAHLLRRWGVSSSDGLASVVIAKTALTVSQIAFILLGIAALFDRLEQQVAGAVWLALLLVVAIAFSLLLVRLQRRGPVSTIWRWLCRVAPRSSLVARLEARAREIDERLSDFYRIERAAFRSATLWHLGGWLLGVIEVWILMALIGAPIGLRDALIVEALAQPIRAASLIIPGGLGAQEIGGVALCTFLGIPEPAGVTLWLLKRARELAFDAVGLAYLTRHTAARAGTW
jgi:putative membrane protein